MRVYAKQKNINVLDENYKHGEVVFSCSYQDYTLEVIVIREINGEKINRFIQSIKKNGVLATKPQLLDFQILTPLNQKLRVEDLITFINKKEKISIDIRDTLNNLSIEYEC